MFTLCGNKKAIFIILTIMILTTITCVSATQENTTIQKNTTTQYAPTQHTQIEYTSTQHTPAITKNITKKQIKREENPENTIYLTETNYQEYKNYEYPENSKIIINESLKNFEMIIEHKNVSITGQNDAKLYNSHVEVFDDGVLYLSNLTFITDDDSKFSQTIYIESNNNVLDNIEFIEKRNEADSRTYYRSINILGDNNTIMNSTFDIIYPSKQISWDTFSSECPFEAIIIHGNYNNLTNNEILIQEGENKEYPFGTIFAVSVRGDYNTIDHNIVSMNGTLYLYGIRIYQSNNMVTNNYVEVHSIRYANGIAIESPQRGTTGNNTLRNNTVIVTTQNTTVPGEPSYYNDVVTDAAYAIMITEYKYTGGGMYTGENSNTIDNLIEGNTITGSSSHMYAIELFGGKDTTISKNNIAIEGVSAMGIAGGGKGTKIVDNTMVVMGQTNETLSSADYYSPQTSGIYLQYGSDAFISGNDITTDHGPAVKTTGESGTVITGNSINVYDNEVAIDIKNPSGITTIIGNAIRDFANHVINGATGEGNYDPDEEPIENPQPGNNSDNPEEPPINDTEVNDTDVPDPADNGTDVPNPVEDKNDTVVPDPVEDKNDTVVPDPVEDKNDTVVPEPEPEKNETEVPEPEPEKNDTVVPDPVEDKNDTVVPEPEPEKNETEVPEPEPEKNDTVVPEPEPEKNNTVIPEPEPEPVDVPEQNTEQNDTTIPETEPKNDTQITPEPEKENETTIPETEPKNDTQITPEPEEENKTTIPEPEDKEETNKTQEKTPTNNTIIPDIVIENNTNVPVNQSTQPAETVPMNNTTPVNDTNQQINQSISSAGEEPDNNDNDNSEPIVNPEPQTNDNTESEDNSENAETNSEEQQENQDTASDEPQDDTRGVTPAAVTATVNAKVYEINKKMPEELSTDHPEIIIALLVILCVAFTYGYLKKR